MSVYKSDSSRSSSASSVIAPQTLISLPSLSCGLSSLPQANSLDGVSIHATSMSAQRNAESEAKLRKVLSKTASSSHAPSAFVPPPMNGAYSPDSPALTMRKPLKQKTQA